MPAHNVPAPALPSWGLWTCSPALHAAHAASSELCNPARAPPNMLRLGMLADVVMHGVLTKSHTQPCLPEGLEGYTCLVAKCGPLSREASILPQN